MELQTLKRAVRLQVVIESQENTPIQLIGLDHYRPSTHYFSLTLPVFKGKQVLSIPMGTSPLRLALKTNAKRIQASIRENYRLLSSKEQALYRLPHNRTLKQYLDFVTEFATNSNYLKSGVYTSQKGNFAILYDDKVRTVLKGEELFTPMRVNTINGDVEASKRYFQHPEIGVFTIIYQFLHELAHYDLATKDEFEADRYGADLFLQLGYPAFSVINFMDSMIYRYEKQYQETNQELYDRRIALIKHLTQKG